MDRARPDRGSAYTTARAAAVQVGVAAASQAVTRQVLVSRKHTAAMTFVARLYTHGFAMGMVATRGRGSTPLGCFASACPDSRALLRASAAAGMLPRVWDTRRPPRSSTGRSVAAGQTLCVLTLQGLSSGSLRKSDSAPQPRIFCDERRWRLPARCLSDNGTCCKGCRPKAHRRAHLVQLSCVCTRRGMSTHADLLRLAHSIHTGHERQAACSHLEAWPVGTLKP